MWRGRASRPAPHRIVVSPARESGSTVLGQRGGTGAAEAPRAGTSCAGPTTELTVGRTPCYSHVSPQLLADSAPHLQNPSCSPRRDTEPRCPGHLAGTTGTEEVKAGHRASSSQLLSPDPVCGFFSPSRAKSIPRPTSTHGWGLWAGWTVPAMGSGGRVSRGQRGAPTPHLLR